MEEEKKNGEEEEADITKFLKRNTKKMARQTGKKTNENRTFFIFYDRQPRQKSGALTLETNQASSKCNPTINALSACCL